jgi:hypothetical protein
MKSFEYTNMEIFLLFFFSLTSGDRKPSKLLCFWIFSVLSFHFCGEISPVKEKLSLAWLGGSGAGVTMVVSFRHSTKA